MQIDVDIDVNSCDAAIITAPVPGFGIGEPCVSNSHPRKTEIKRGGARPGSGRPAIETERPWDVEGVSRATYYRRQSPPPTLAYVAPVPRWSVIAFWGQAEISATSELTRAGYETYLPMVAIRRRDPVITTKFNIIRVPYLSGYGFIRITSVESREPILATRGIREVLLRPDGRPGCVSDGEIERLRAKDAERLELPKVFAPVLPVGSVVQLEEGPFASFSGLVIQCDGLKTQVGVEMFGRITPIWLNRTSVIPLAKGKSHG